MNHFVRSGWGRRLVCGILLAVGLVIAAAPPATAQSARELKATGTVGEGLDGYLGVVADASGQVKNAVKAINAKRRKAYQKAAKDSGRPFEEVQAVAGARLRDKAKSGDWVQNAAGRWIQVK